MDTQHINAYLKLIEALLHCAKGEEWLLLQQHEELIDAELLTVMEQVANQLKAEGNAAAAKFLHYWTVQLTHLLQQNITSETLEESRAESYLKLIQTLLGCSKGDEVAILSQHPDLIDEGLIYTMNQVAAQLALKGDRDIAIYLKHLAAEVNRVWLHPGEGRTPISSPPPNNQIDTPPSKGIATANKLQPDEGLSTATTPTPISSSLPNIHINAPIDPAVTTENNLHPVGAASPAEHRNKAQAAAPPNNHIEELLEKISSRLEKLEVSIGKDSSPFNPLWYMPILEQVATQGWMISSEEVEQLIGTKPHCAPGHNSFVRGCWKFLKAGKVGTHSSWRVVKEITILPSDSTPEPEGTKLEPDLSSPWSEGN